MNLKVLDINGKETGQSVKLPEKVFAIDPNDHAIWLDVRSIRANNRQGTHASKNRSAVRGGGKKPFRQKGTGRARQGTSRAPHHTGGGIVFGPSPRTYSVGINKKVKVLAKKSALTYKAKNKDLIIVKNFESNEVSTKNLMNMLDALSLADSKVLFLTEKNERKLYLSSKNLYKIEMRESTTFSTYDVLNAKKLIMQEGVLNAMNEVYGK
jgi:large subunit ribosomal protein L4